MRYAPSVPSDGKPIATIRGVMYVRSRSKPACWNRFLLRLTAWRIARKIFGSFHPRANCVSSSSPSSLSPPAGDPDPPSSSPIFPIISFLPIVFARAGAIVDLRLSIVRRSISSVVFPAASKSVSSIFLTKLRGAGRWG